MTRPVYCDLMAMKHYLAWTVMLAALPGAKTKCDSCNFDLEWGTNKSLAFLDPGVCCEKVDYPFTFLANFIINEHNVTFHLHEYYLLDTEVRHRCFKLPSDSFISESSMAILLVGVARVGSLPFLSSVCPADSISYYCMQHLGFDYLLT